ncbi:hypothetical protein [Natronoflexus pectinivorans]|uniref:SPW repeat-containing protein n=1 Tax=Natronoflexus pectinivorans TaxID=682526 RepID=A0A4R2GHS6_9BACT|nr:hypothetical protein [Natronoflexus pectinivorans]TCO06829.1 hypothetical protein EV194_11252 [Natronoflexus pectinivorans]
MKAHKISLVNAFVLIIFGIWAYVQSDNPSFTALIPVFLGGLLLAFNQQVYRESTKWLTFAVVLTFLAFTGLFMPLIGAISRSDSLSIFRVVTMLATSFIALVFLTRRLILVLRNN